MRNNAEPYCKKQNLIQWLAQDFSASLQAMGEALKLRHGLSSEDVEDAVSDTFVKLCETDLPILKSKFENGQHPMPLLVKMLKDFMSTEADRKKKRTADYHQSEDGFAYYENTLPYNDYMNELSAERRYATLSAKLNKLRPRDRRVIQLLEDGYEHHEIASEMGIENEATVRTVIKRARKRAGELLRVKGIVPRICN